MIEEFPIVALISTYREGLLARGAVRSALSCCKQIIVCEGLTEAEHVPGPETQLNELYPFVDWMEGEWESETAKRTAILGRARELVSDEFWCLVLDADEVLVWGENLPDFLAQLRPMENPMERVPRFRITEIQHVPVAPYPPLNPNGKQIAQYRRELTTHVGTYEDREPGAWTDLAPYKLYHSSLIQEYHVGAWQILTPGGEIAMLDRRKSETPPAYGEPHIHHRPYLRRDERAKMRLSEGEERRWLDERGLKRSGES